MTLEACGRLIIHDGGSGSPPVLQPLFNALDLSGCHASLQNAATKVARSFIHSDEAKWQPGPATVSNYNFGIKLILLSEVIPEKLQGTLLKSLS